MASGYPRHRRSIFSGLLLILIGGLFLIHNFGGRLPIWRLLERWWPLIFILWGLAKLYDHFMAQRTGETAPPTISAGEILLVLLLLAVVGGAGIFEWGSNHPNRGEILFPWDQSYSFTENVPVVSVPANAQITVRTTRGNITLTGDDISEIRVTARKSVNAESQSDAQSRADRVHVTVTPSGNAYIIEPQGENGEGSSISTELEIHVPKGVSLNVNTEHGAIQISGVSGNITTEGHSGEIEIRQSGGDVTVDSHPGDDVRVVGAAGNVRVSGRGTQVEVSDVKGAVTVDGEFYGPITFARLAEGIHFVSQRSDVTVTQLSGRMEMTSPGDLGIYDSAGNVTLTTTKRDLTLENVAGKIQLDNHNGNVTLRFPQPPHEQIDVTTQSGDIDVTLPAKSAFDISARADRGELDCDFGDLASKIDKQNGNSRLDGSVGMKGPKLQFHTTYGTIRLRKGQ
jgi:DUF4097 and DUF4098 domain-containing protein YvlB